MGLPKSNGEILSVLLPSLTKMLGETLFQRPGQRHDTMFAALAIVHSDRALVEIEDADRVHFDPQQIVVSPRQDRLDPSAILSGPSM